MALNQHHNRYRVHEGNEGQGEEDWLISYADMVTLLMCFFLAMASISKVDMGLFEQMKKGLRTDVGKQKEVKTPIAEIKYDLDSLLSEEKKAGNVSVDQNSEGIVLEFSSSAFYQVGKAEFNPDAGAILDKVTGAIKGITYYNFQIDIEGHTDNVPIKSLQFPSNWELSVNRATNIVKYLIGEGISADRL
ncbi:MAG: flagellar motor protein MotB, partial [Fibrobacterota bacterium]